jgi:hypothetical protein
MDNADLQFMILVAIPLVIIAGLARIVWIIVDYRRRVKTWEATNRIDFLMASAKELNRRGAEAAEAMSRAEEKGHGGDTEGHGRDTNDQKKGGGVEESMS